METAPAKTENARSSPDTAADPVIGARRAPGARLAVIVVVMAIVAAAGYIGYARFRGHRLADSVRRLFAERRYDQAREPMNRWLGERPNSAEARYYQAWLALVDDRPSEVVQAVQRAHALGFDRASLDILQAVYNARGGRKSDAEPILERAFQQGLEPRAEVARELARIYLASYRLTQAAEVVGRYRELVPTDPQPYLWSNEIASRTGGTPTILIRNLRAALERDPHLDTARLALAEQLSKDRRYDEAEREYRAYLARNPSDAAALVGLGRNAFQMGEIDEATRDFEAALAVDPRQVDALKELAQLDMRFGRFAQARGRLERLTQLEPFDHEIRYSYAQALRFVGEVDRARAENERASRLRREQEEIVRLRARILDDPDDRDSRLEVARWMLSHGHEEEGLKWTREILRIDPGHAATHQVLADHYAARGDRGLANYHRAMASTGPIAR